MDAYGYMDACMHSCMLSCMYAIHTCRHAYIHTFMHVYKHTSIHSYIHGCVCMCVYMHVSTHAWMYACINVEGNEMMDGQTNKWMAGGVIQFHLSVMKKNLSRVKCSLLLSVKLTSIFFLHNLYNHSN